MLELRRIILQDLEFLQEWYDDEEMARRMSYPSEEWLKYVMGTDEAKCWVIIQNADLVAQIQLDRDDDIGFIDLAVRPDLHGQRIGTRSLALFLENEGHNYSMIKACIEPDNIASLRCFEKCGFTFSEETDSEGFVHGQIRLRSDTPVS